MMTRPSALKLVPLVLVILIAALPAGARARTIERSFGNWKATFSGTFDYEWSEPNPEPCHPNGDGSVRARFSGRLGEFEISYLRKGAFRAFGLGNDTKRVNGSVTETDNRRINPPPPDRSYTCEPGTIDKSGCGTHGYDHATFSLDSTTSDRRLFGPFALHMKMDLGGTLNAFASNPCYAGGSLEDFGYFSGNSPSDDDTAGANWKYRLGSLVGPRLRVAMFARRRAFTVSAQDTHRSTFKGPASYTGRRFVQVTFTPVGHEPTVEELSAGSITVLHRGGFRAILLPPGTTAKFTWQMKRSYPSQWTTLGMTTNPVFPYTFRLAGNFKIRVIAQLARPPWRLVSTEKPLEVRFPTWGQIVTEQAVRSFTLDAWLRTLRLTTPTARHELGFWISLNTCSGKYAHTTTIIGPPNGDEVTIGRRPADIPSNPPAVSGCATYMVASFHTHTPTTYRAPPGARGVGPSPDDETVDRQDMVPGVVFDYIANPPGSESIPFGYPIHSGAQRYRSGLPRRPTPPT
jgi:hypothetical protein